MKTQIFLTLALCAVTQNAAYGQAGAVYTNFVRQVQLPTGVIRDVSILPAGVELSPLAIDPGGARFELWTVKSDPLTVYLLDTRYVGTYVPMADVQIRTEDPNTYTGVPRTRADRPFVVDVATSGLRNEVDAPSASKAVKLLRHVQSYGVDGTGEGIDRSQAILNTQVLLVNNANHRLSYSVTSVPGADLTKLRGEERFSVYSLADYQAPESQISSMYVQIWPLSDGNISGIEPGQKIRFKLPQITLTYNDLYPDSRTYAQVYKGAVRSNVEGTIVPGSGDIHYDAVPKSRVMPPINNWDSVIDSDGDWTIEILTVTPFDIQRLHYVTFEVDRTIEMNGSFTTIE